MFGQGQISDKELLKTVDKRLVRGGGTSVKADVQGGTVTLRGKIQYEAQRRPLLKLTNSIAGVRRVIDQLVLQAKRTQ
jgi:osmotically-inducible protein OsmY